MTGAELTALRRATGMTQAQLAARAGIGRHAVTYWEAKAKVCRNAWAVKRIAGVLTLPPAWATLRGEALGASDVALIALAARLTLQSARRRVKCGAKTRKGTPCRCQSEPGKKRCKFHGGMSTGAQTPEGRARIAEAQRRRWAKWRAAKGQADA